MLLVRLIVPFLAALLAFATPAGARGGATPVDAELVLAVDVSYSMDEDEQKLQRGGYVAALTSADFLHALKSGPLGKVAITYIEWASSRDQKVLVEWMVIDGPEAAAGFAARLDRAPYRRASRTSVAGAIDASMALFENNGFDGTRRVIDVSGDGPNNDGRLVTLARDEAVAQGVTINGLPLLIRPVRAAYMDIEDLDLYYRDCVIGGPGSFMIPVRDVKSFVDATRTKLVLEIASRPHPEELAKQASRRMRSGGLASNLPRPSRRGLTPAPQGEEGQGDRLVTRVADRPSPSCTAGEELWRRRYMGE